MFIIRGWLTVSFTDVKILMAICHTNYFPYYNKISVDVRVNYSLTTTLLWYYADDNEHHENKGQAGSQVPVGGKSKFLLNDVAD